MRKHHLDCDAWFVGHCRELLLQLECESSKVCYVIIEREPKCSSVADIFAGTWDYPIDSAVIVGMDGDLLPDLWVEDHMPFEDDSYRQVPNSKWELHVFDSAEAMLITNSDKEIILPKKWKLKRKIR